MTLLLTLAWLLAVAEAGLSRADRRMAMRIAFELDEEHVGVSKR